MKYKTFWLAGILAPMMVANLAHAVDANIATGVEHTLFVDGGNVYGMGGNSYGAIKNEGTAKFLTPQFIGIGNVKAVAAGYGNSAALKTDGTVVMWGRKTQPTYLVGAPIAPFVPPIGNGITDIAFNGNAFLFVKNGIVYKWDYVNAPVAISYPGDGMVKSIAAGEQHVVALFTDGTVGTYGVNNCGQLGNGVLNQGHAYVTRIAGITGAVQIAAGRNNSFVTTNTGDVFGFGANSSNQMGDGMTANWLTPKPLPYIKGAKKVYGGNIATLALMPDGSMRAGGFPDMIYGTYGTPSYIYNYAKTWTTLAAVSGATDIAQGWGDANMFRTNASGAIYGWSMNRMGQIGSNSTLPELHTIAAATFTSGLVATPVTAPVAATPVTTQSASAVMASPFQAAPSPVTAAPVVAKPVVTPVVTVHVAVPVAPVTAPAPVAAKPGIVAPVATPPVATKPVLSTPAITVPVIAKPVVPTPVAPVPAIGATTYASMQQCVVATTPNIGQGQACKDVIVPADRGNGTVVQASKGK